MSLAEIVDPNVNPRGIIVITSTAQLHASYVNGSSEILIPTEVIVEIYRNCTNPISKTTTTTTPFVCQMGELCVTIWEGIPPTAWNNNDQTIRWIDPMLYTTTSTWEEEWHLNKKRPKVISLQIAPIGKL
jgi:hypothetical protein